MRAGQFERAKRIVAAALDRPPEQRAAYVHEACGDDAEVRAEVESLLAHDHDTPSMLITGGLGGADWASVLDELAPEQPEPAGKRIGPYEIVGTLGRGGMGTVYHGRQVEPVRRDVAIKLIKRGMDTDRIVARFEAERQTLAVLDHSGIARMLDAGADEQGRPYFVMEMVRGVPITDYADVRRLAVSERLELFLQVCQAVQHAHQKGVLHRDIKPSNVLVTEQDGAAIPKVIDFGVAKVIDPGLDVTATLTEHGQFVGTPEYMSPEQAGAYPGSVDTRSDVYSLGVLLYELLTGRRPYRLRGLPIAEIQRVIATEEPLQPSTAVTQPDETTASSPASQPGFVAEARSSSPPRLSRDLAGDLDNIVLKALRKEPERRYAGAEQLAADVRRHLEGRPVEARQDTFSYRAGKFVQRHRFGVAVAAAAIVALAGFAATITYQRNRALQAESRAEQEAATASQVSECLVDLFREADPQITQGDELSARALLDQGAERIEESLADQPAVQAALMTTMSEAYTGIQAPGPALELAQRSLELNRELYGGPHVEVANSLVALAAANAAGSRPDLAMPLYREALTMREELLEPDAPDIIESKRLLALNLHTMAEFEEAESLYREVLEMTRRVYPEDGPEVTGALQNVGEILHAQGKVDEALDYLQEALARARDGEADPLTTADIASELGVLLKNMDRPEEAEPLYREALEIRQRVLGDHPFTAQSHNNLGVFLRGIGRDEEALEHAERALEVYRASLGDNHRDVGIAYSNLGSSYRDVGRLDEAEGSYRAGLASLGASMGSDYWVYGQVQYNLGVLLRDQERFAEAEDLMVTGYEKIRDALGEDSNRALLTLEGVVKLYEEWGREEQAAKYRALLPEDHGR